MKKEKEVTIKCPQCKKEVVPVKKMFNTLLCPTCGIIIGGEYAINKSK